MVTLRQSRGALQSLEAVGPKGVKKGGGGFAAPSIGPGLILVGSRGHDVAYKV